MGKEELVCAIHDTKLPLIAIVVFTVHALPSTHRAMCNSNHTV